MVVGMRALSPRVRCGGRLDSCRHDLSRDHRAVGARTNRTPDIVIASASQLADEFARRLLMRAQVAIDERRRFAIAIPGGSIAGAFLPVLGRTALPWESTALFWVDERFVPTGHPESNAGAARMLLAGSPAAGMAHWYPMEIGHSMEATAHAYARRLVRALGNPPALDVALLGVGEDGHVASLFPGHAPLDGEWVAIERAAPKPPHERITLTYAALAAADVVCLAAVGAHKAGIMRSLFDAASADLPARRVLANAREAWIFVDEAAGSLLDPAMRPAPGGHD